MPWGATALAAAVFLVIRPLDVGDPGFVLTFGATAALVEGARRGVALLPRARVLSWIVATPTMHAIHHSVRPEQMQSNFSSGLGIWDRLHGTARFDAEIHGLPGSLRTLAPRPYRVGLTPALSLLSAEVRDRIRSRELG